MTILSKRRVLLVGASGMLGSAIVEAVLARPELSLRGRLRFAVTPMLSVGKRHIKIDFPTPFPHRTRTLPSSRRCGIDWRMSASRSCSKWSARTCPRRFTWYVLNVINVISPRDQPPGGFRFSVF